MAVTDGGGTRMHVYAYDDIYQITEVNYPSGYDYLATDTTFSYDAAGNRTSVIDAGGTSSYVTNALNQYTAVGGVSYDYDDNGNLTQDEKFQYAYDPENRLTGATKLAGTPDPLTSACDTTLVFTTGGAAPWFRQTTTYHDGGDAAQSGDIGDSQESWLETTVEGEGTLTFYWNVSSESGSDYLQLFIDGSYDTSISGSQSWQQVSRNIVGLGTHTIRWVYDKDETGTSGSDCGWVDNVQWTPASNPPVAALAAAVDHASLDFITGGHADWSDTTLQPYYDGDCARSGYIGTDEKSDMATTVSGSGTLTFYWKIAADDYYDRLEFFVDGVSQGYINESVAWTQKQVSISGAGNHTLLWRYSEKGGASSYAYVDYVQWSGAGPIADPPDWQTVSYTYDPAGRRVEKKVDGTTQVKFVYDGDHIIAEYNGAGSLLRKYVHGPAVDEPICMIEANGSYAGTHYYHYDALGNIVAMTNSSGTVVQLYEYSVYGQVAASDANYPNRFMFTGREFDKDTGLYYYRARYYNPEIGRFLQTDPVGYGDGMNWYGYCTNNPVNRNDPFGLTSAEEYSANYCYDPCEYWKTLSALEAEEKLLEAQIYVWGLKETRLDGEIERAKFAIEYWGRRAQESMREYNSWWILQELMQGASIVSEAVPPGGIPQVQIPTPRGPVRIPLEEIVTGVAITYAFVDTYIDDKVDYWWQQYKLDEAGHARAKKQYDDLVQQRSAVRSDLAKAKERLKVVKREVRLMWQGISMAEDR